MPQQRGYEANFKRIRGESMKFDKQALRKAAEKATEGNYVVGHCDINKHGNLSSVYVCQEWNGEAGGVVAECHVNCLTQNSDQVYANAGFIAFASPANVISLIEEISTLEAKCAALAAENAGLKDTLSAVIDRSNEPDYQSIGMGCGVEDNGLQTDGYNACEYGWREAMDRIYSEVIPDTIPETPATDAFLAEVRAHDLNAFIRHHSAELDAHIKNGGEQFDEKSVRIRDIIVSARLFREQIRKEAAQ